MLWLTDITEFRLPGGEKVYLSPVIDCFGGMLVAWSIELHPRQAPHELEPAPNPSEIPGSTGH